MEDVLMPEGRLKRAHDNARSIVQDLLRASHCDAEVQHVAQIAVLSAWLDDLLSTSGVEATVHVLMSVAASLEQPTEVTIN